MNIRAKSKEKQKGKDDMAAQVRARDLGLYIGEMEPGARNKISDVKGLLVGHETINTARHKTGVTVVIPAPDNVFLNKVTASAHVLNGFGKTLGLVQVQELGTGDTEHRRGDEYLPVDGRAIAVYFLRGLFPRAYDDRHGFVGERFERLRRTPGSSAGGEDH
jgi:hypothetical protein